MVESYAVDDACDDAGKNKKGKTIATWTNARAFFFFFFAIPFPPTGVGGVLLGAINIAT